MKILFGTVFGMTDMTLAFEVALGKFLKSKGHEVKFLICNSGLKACIFDSPAYLTGDKSLKQKLNRRIKCEYCTLNAKRTLEAAGFSNEILSLKDFSSDVIGIGSSFRREESEDLNVFEHAKSTTLRNLLVGDINHDVRSQEVIRAFSESSVLYRDDLGGLFNDERFDCLICVHGIYQEHGVLIDVAKSKGVNVFVYGFAYRKNTFFIFPNDTYHRAIWSIPDSTWEEIEMTDKRRSIVMDYLFSKQSGGRDIVNYHPNPLEDPASILQELGLSNDCVITTFYTNVLWDANIFYGDTLFSNGISEATIYLINLYKETPDMTLVIRIHPAEVKGGFNTRKRFIDLISEAFPILPHNVRVIDSSSDISSYALASLSINNIIYGSNIGLELACRGHSVIVIGDAYIKGKSFVRTPWSLEDLRMYCLNLKGPLEAREVEKALLYFYFLNFKISIDIDHFRYDGNRLKNVDFSQYKSHADNAFYSPNFEQLEKQIIQGIGVFDYLKFNEYRYE
jgi:hypothetical protein